MSTDQRRAELRQALLEAAERRIASDGIKALKARELAAEAGCATGQIYNVWSDLDGLVIAVNARTLSSLDEILMAARAPADMPPADQARALLLGQAEAYLDFARHNGHRWRAVFEHRRAGSRAFPSCSTRLDRTRSSPSSRPMTSIA